LTPNHLGILTKWSDQKEMTRNRNRFVAGAAETELLQLKPVRESMHHGCLFELIGPGSTCCLNWVLFASYPVNVWWVSWFLQEFWVRNKCIGCPLHVHVVKGKKETCQLCECKEVCVRVLMLKQRERVVLVMVAVEKGESFRGGFIGCLKLVTKLCSCRLEAVA